ncbi:MAG: zinc ABC transporter substrate-binding protein [Salinibacterium sp.]|nr:zinc ABC transporter substrate-binding protein [Salinibacterium sp.]
MKKFIGIGAAAVLALAGCSAPAPDDGLVHIVASTSVYGDVAARVAGDLASVTSFIDGPNIDPHSFEASARNQLAIAGADLVIENGGGYDPFMDSLVKASGSDAPIINAFETSGLAGPNEHVWYSFDALEKVVAAIVVQLGAIDPVHRATYEANGDALSTEITGLSTMAAAIATTGDVAVTELVPVYLLETVGLANVTPADFTEAIEEGNDVPPLALQDTLRLFSEGSVRLLAYNSQTASPETERVRQAAEAAGVPVVEFTETLPTGADYVSWMTANLNALASALRS